MRIVVLAASGSTGHQLAAQALDRGHPVLALARDPRKANLPRSGPVSPTRRTIALAEFKRPALMPARVTRATVAAAMLDEAEKSQHPGEIVVPLP
jgi:nucleoside-diphosphate-sugar epimerase